MPTEDLIPENVLTPTKVMNVELIAMQIHKLTRNVEELKAEIFENFEKMYKTFVLMYIDVEYLKEKLFKFLKEFEALGDDVEKLVKGHKDAKGRSVNFEEKLNRVKLLLTCCDWLLLMYEEVEGLRTSNLAGAYEEAVEKYLAFKDLSNFIFDSFPSDETALKEFPIVSVLDQKANFVAADLIVKMKKKFFENIMWTKDLVQTKLTIKCFMVESPNTWMEIVDSLHKMDRLERLLTQLFDDLMTHFFRPIMDSAYLNSELSDCSFTLNHNPLQKSKLGRKPKLLIERIMTFISLADFVSKNMETPLDGDQTSLFERFGSRGRGKALFEFLIGCLSPDRTGLKPETCKPFIDTITTLIVGYTRKKFIKEDEASFLLTQLNLLTSEPSLYPVLVSKASKLVQENIRFGVRVGSKMVTDGDEEGGDDDVGGGDDFSPVACSPFRGLYERCEELMPNLLKFKECCVSLSGSRIVDLFYEAIEVKANQPIIDQTIQNSSSTFMDSTANITTTSFDMGSSQLKGDVPSIKPIMKKSSEEEVLRTWRCMRLVAELFIECVPAIHKEDIKEDAMTVALHHNDCMYIAHHLTLLQHHLRPRSGQQTSKKSKPSLPIGLTSYDLQYDLEKLASKSLVSFLLRKQVELVDVLKSSFEKKDAKESTKDVYKRQMDALTDVGNKILKLKKAWIGVLQKDVLHKALGVLSSKIIDITINHFTDLSSKFIPRKQTSGSDNNNNKKQLLSFVAACLNHISDKLIAPLFLSTSSSSPTKVDLSKVISNWRKFKEVCFITEPFVSHRMMMERWCVKDERRGGVMAFDTNIVGEILTPPEARAFLSLAFEGEEREESLRLFK